MQESEFVFDLVFFLFSFCIIYPPTEFESTGLTVNSLFSSLLGSVDIEIIQFHLRRTCLTIFVHTVLPFFYIICYYLKFGTVFEYDAQFFIKYALWNSFVICTFLLPLISIFAIYIWCKDDFQRHPIAVNLRKYNRDSWLQAAVDINAEFRRDDKIMMKTSAVHSLIATQNWIIKVSNYSLNIVHQSDTALIVIQSDSHDFSDMSPDSIQFVNIRVKPTRADVSEFLIRINALDFKTLQDRMLRPITILDGVQFNKTVIDRFVDVFKHQIQSNPIYSSTEMNELCFACMQVQPNIKLQKNCLDENGSELSNCGQCYCRPMWCVTCIAKWFASRQNQDEKDLWLQQKCTCPMCRAKFCILDVSYIEY